MQYYPDNTLSDFTTMLPNTIDLKGDWEVGIVEIQYPHNWYNVPKRQNDRLFVVSARLVDQPNGEVAQYMYFISEGYYSSPQELVAEIQKEANEAINVTGNVIQLHYDPVTRKVSATPSMQWTLYMAPYMQQMLGMDYNTFDAEHWRAPEVVDMDPVDSMYVYCDVVEPRVVGDSQVPLLRIVPVEGKHGDLVTRIYENVHYIRLQKKTFRTVEINIRDRTGKKVSFEQGTLNVTLHFRQRKRFSTL